ncbi:hypothetical protein FRC06_004273 [Ceratobasidium sp. 370]|nr:hypothetical protein FRC06_004273 [Ceratobasidium sp. 370]
MAPRKEKTKGRKVKKVPEETPLALSVEENDSPTPLGGSDFSWLNEEETLPHVNDKELHDKCIAVLDTLRDQELDFGLYLISTLHNVRIPPRTGSKGSRPTGAQKQIDNFALGLVGRRLREEMREFETNYMNLKPESFMEKEVYESVNYDSIEAMVFAFCPTLFMLFYMLSTCVYRRGHWASNAKDSDFFVVMVITCMAYNLSSYNNAMQRLLGYYFHAKHVPKAVINLLSEMNLCMSYSSITDSLSKVGRSIRKAMREAVEKFPILFVHDNIRIKHPVRSQRHNNQTVTDNGTAMSVIVLPESARAAWEDPEAVRALRAHIENQRALGTPSHITFTDLNCPVRQARVLTHKLYHLFDILRAIPCLKGVDILASSILQRPPGEHELQSGPEHRQEEPNGFDRLDPFIFIFGWFHALLCLASSIFENHRGSAAGLGFTHSVLALGRTGFSKNMRRNRPDYHLVKEYLMHEFESHVRGLWLLVTGTHSLDELNAWLQDHTRTAEDILNAGQRIQYEYISKPAVSLYSLDMEELPETADHVFLGTLVQNRDLEMFWDLRHAVKNGKVGHTEDLIPELLIFFTGGRNSNYAKQMYDILQILYHESTPAIRHSIREHCWLVNMKGRPNSFYPVDQRQEFNNKAIREYGPPPQGGTSWEDYAKSSPLIPMYADIIEHVESSVHKVQRSLIHKDPTWEKDLEILLKDHAKTQLLVQVPGRKFASKSDRGKDFMKLGSIALQDTNVLAKYETQHALFFRSRVTENDLSDYIQRPSRSPSEQPETPQSTPTTSLEPPGSPTTL